MNQKNFSHGLLNGCSLFCMTFVLNFVFEFGPSLKLQTLTRLLRRTARLVYRCFTHVILITMYVFVLFLCTYIGFWGINLPCLVVGTQKWFSFFRIVVFFTLIYKDLAFPSLRIPRFRILAQWLRKYEFLFN